MKPAFILFLSLLATHSFSQITSIWKGKTPGHECDWNWPCNWSNNRLPDDFTDVFIPVDNTLTYNYPVIKSDCIEINSLNMHRDASLIILNGKLSILDSAKSHYRKDQIQGKVKYEKPDPNSIPGDELTTIKSNKF
ncbi:MAG: hypothetical protein IPP15_15475 [Saprospiraceae bacterium]|uniref:Organic solvent tolerance-like N-terminal domain-containing protein n=1 Tax=Candidatus Opimibacter skivensis TaxID=2982028 RepID=A0A9D7SUX8_9BACT|nr:hypothetical protein [Candidatus Opimibacter skivensis]